jgi:hypothetical protein
LLLAVLSWLVAPGAPAFAGCEFGVRTDTPEINERARRLVLSPEQVAERTDFLIESLESRQRYATRWHRIWVASYSIGLVVGAARAGIADGDGARAEHLVTATKAAIGLVQIYGRPVCDRFGADPILKMPDATEEDRMRRLVAAEDLLNDNGKLDASRWTWLPHLFNAALNLAGAGVLLAIDEPERAGMSGSVGLVFGELYIWTQPKGADRDWHEYRRRFGDESEEQWSFGVMPGGVALQYRF